ncbi:MAG: type II secretion system protein [Bacilli bacterium]|nr:type II secretion system protein [Bacilli bacterium]
MKKNKKHSFSLIELICIIGIVSVLIIMFIIVSIKVIENSKINDKLAQEKYINDACEAYIYSNRNKAPSVIGDTVNIDLKTLKNENYLDKDIYNSKNESCMDNSYVRVYKLNQKEYTYLPYLYCGKSKRNEVEELPTPIVKALFIDSNDEDNNTLIFNNLNQSRLYIEMIGGVDSFGREIEIDTYEITISMSTNENKELKEYYYSGKISANKRYTYVIDQKILGYVNANDATSIKVVVKTINVLGGVSEVTSIAQSNNKEN